jgi:hypothetical protein
MKKYILMIVIVLMLFSILEGRTYIKNISIGKIVFENRKLTYQGEWNINSKLPKSIEGDYYLIDFTNNTFKYDCKCKFCKNCNYIYGEYIFEYKVNFKSELTDIIPNDFLVFYGGEWMFFNLDIIMVLHY